MISVLELEKGQRERDELKRRISWLLPLLATKITRLTNEPEVTFSFVWGEVLFYTAVRDYCIFMMGNRKSFMIESSYVHVHPSSGELILEDLRFIGDKLEEILAAALKMYPHLEQVLRLEFA